MLRTYATGRMWPFRGVSDLPVAARRAQGVARSLGWGPQEADALCRTVLELMGHAIEQSGGGTCRLEAGESTATIMVEDLSGGHARARVGRAGTLAAAG